MKITETMTDNLDELKRQWQSLPSHDDELERTNRELGERLLRGKVSGTQQQLARRVERRSLVGLLLVVFAPIIYWELHMPLWYALCYGAFGVAMGAAQQCLARYIKGGRLAEMPVVEALERALRIGIWQKRLRMTGILAGAVLLFLFFYILTDQSRELLVGAILGLVVGLAIAVPMARKDISLARKLVDDLRE